MALEADLAERTTQLETTSEALGRTQDDLKKLKYEMEQKEIDMDAMTSQLDEKADMLAAATQEAEEGHQVLPLFAEC